MPRKQENKTPEDLPFSEVDEALEECDCPDCNEEGWGNDPAVESVMRQINWFKGNIEEERIATYLLKLGKKFLEINAIMEEVEGTFGEERAETILEEAQSLHKEDIEALNRIAPVYVKLNPLN